MSPLEALAFAVLRCHLREEMGLGLTPSGARKAVSRREVVRVPEDEPSIHCPGQPRDFGR